MTSWTHCHPIRLLPTCAAARQAVCKPRGVMRHTARVFAPVECLGQLLLVGIQQLHARRTHVLPAVTVSDATDAWHAFGKNRGTLS